MVAEPSTPADDAVTLAEMDISRSLAVQFTFVGTLGFVVALGVFGTIYQLATGEAPNLGVALVDATWWNGALSALVFLALFTVIIVPHEWVHGLAIQYYGGTPRYGVGLAHFVLPYAYATTDHSFSRNQFAVVLLAPLVGLTAVGVPVMIAFEWGWLLVPLAANAGGAVGDLWMLLVVLSFPPTSLSRTWRRASGSPAGRATRPAASRSRRWSGTPSSARRPRRWGSSSSSA